MIWAFVAGAVFSLVAVVVAWYVREESWGELWYGLRNILPMFICWLGLRLMSKRMRHEWVYGIQHRHTMRGLPDLYEGVR